MTFSLSFCGAFRMWRQGGEGFAWPAVFAAPLVPARLWQVPARHAIETCLQAFLALFDAQLLRPGDDLDIDRVTILFMVLKGSTALYERIGDSRAYHLLREFGT